LKAVHAAAIYGSFLAEYSQYYIYGRYIARWRVLCGPATAMLLLMAPSPSVTHTHTHTHTHTQSKDMPRRRRRRRNGRKRWQHDSPSYIPVFLAAFSKLRVLYTKSYPLHSSREKKNRSKEIDTKILFKPIYLQRENS